MDDVYLTINTWDVLFIIVGVILYVLVLMMTYTQPYLMRLVIAGSWLLYVVAKMMLGGTDAFSKDKTRATRVIDLGNLGMALCATLYEVSTLITQNSWRMSPSF